MRKFVSGRLSWPAFIKSVVYTGLRSFFHLLPMTTATRSRVRAWLLPHFRPLLELLLHHPQQSWPELDHAFGLGIGESVSADNKAPAFVENPAPLVSIVVPACNHVECTLACLRSIHDNCSSSLFEVIVVDDHSQDATQSLVKRIPGLRYLRNSESVGSITSRNRAAAAAKGRFLVFLSNDMVVQRGWLEELMRTMKDETRAGLVGSQLINEDGSLQAAGGVVWSDGSGGGYGHGQDRRRPEFNYLRNTGYCSSASIIMEKCLFDAVDGFDERFASACEADIDLAFKVREAGYRVLYQPWSRVVRFDERRCKRPAMQAKRCPVSNQLLIKDKWAEAVKQLPPGPQAVGWSGREEDGYRILIIDACTPTPDRDSGSVDAFMLMQLLRSMSCDVSFMADNLQFLGSYTPALQRMGVKCLYLPFVTDGLEYIRNYGTQYDLVLLTRFYVAEKYIDEVRKHCNDAKVGFIVVDLHYLRQERRAETHGSRKLHKAAARTKELEQKVIRKSDLTIVKSDIEQQLLRKELGACRTFLLPLIIDIPDRCDTPYCERKNFVFVGGFQHPPNVDAVHHMIDAVWPHVSGPLPDARLLIVGADMPEDILSISAHGVEILGHVRDLSALLNQCRVMVAPLRYGAGVKGKVGRSLGHGLPCVATPMAVEGMALTDGVDVLVADCDEIFAEKCVELYTNDQLWRRISDNGLAFFERELSLTAGREKVRQMLGELGIVL